MLQASSGRKGKKTARTKFTKPGRSLLAEPCTGRLNSGALYVNYPPYQHILGGAIIKERFHRHSVSNIGVPYHEEEEGMDGGGRWLGKLAIGEHR